MAAKDLKPGLTAEIVTTVDDKLEVDGHKLCFKVEAHDRDKKVGVGTHCRAIVVIQRKT